MNREQTIQAVKEIITQIIQDKAQIVPEIDESTVLLGEQSLPIDSLDLGAIVVEMQLRTGFDPFQDGIIMFRTVGDLAKLYVK